MEYVVWGLVLGAAVQAVTYIGLRRRINNADACLSIIIGALIREGVIEEITKGDLAAFDGEAWIEGEDE